VADLSNVSMQHHSQLCFQGWAGPTVYLGLLIWSFHTGFLSGHCQLKHPNSNLEELILVYAALVEGGSNGTDPLGCRYQALVCGPMNGPLPIDPGTGFYWQRVAKQRTICNGSFHWASHLRQGIVACGAVTCVNGLWSLEDVCLLSLFMVSSGTCVRYG
jgi:hypothetical protein